MRVNSIKFIKSSSSIAARTVLAVIAVVSITLGFSYLGNAFRLVLLPLILFGLVAYRLHKQRLEQHTSQIFEAGRLHLATVEALATAIDARDQVGFGHVRRTQIYAVGIGNALGLDDDDLNALRTAALLHDIGKLAVPEHILNKPGRLTSAEYEKTKIHSIVGASILDRVGFPYPVVPTVRHHHESWNGEGYPDGLAGNEIPLTARILAVADAFDTLRGARPFRPAVGREDACNFLRSRSGAQFDPNIVNTLLKNLHMFEGEINRCGLDYENETKREKPLTSIVKERTTTNYIDQIKKANLEVFSLYEMARNFGSSVNLKETLRLLTKKIREFVPYDTCVVYLVDDNSYATAIHSEGRNSERMIGKRIISGEGATGRVIKDRLTLDNVDPAADLAGSHPDLYKEYKRMTVVPLLADDKLIGAVSLLSARPEPYEEEHVRLLETISRIAADAIDKSIKHAETETYALTDPLTGLPNARSLQRQFEIEIGRSRRNGHAVQLLMLDLDGFKAVNDTFGHKAGDSMLQEISKIIRYELRDYDFLARYGGDEFIALVPETDSSEVTELCRRIESAVDSFVMSIEGSIAKVGVSIGAAGYPKHGETFEELISVADKAMYRTKRFHKQKNRPLEEPSKAVDLFKRDEEPFEAEVLPTAPLPYTIIEGQLGELIVELDENHIVTTSSIN